MQTEDSRAIVASITRWFESLTPGNLGQLEAFYSADARFKDPFNDVRGVPAITQIFKHMFVALHEPRFVVTQQIVDGAQAFLVWEFRFRFKRFDTVTEQVIHGGSHLTLTEDGRISEHRDYWDAAEELYEKLPGLGALMRWLKRKANS
ncbi:MAG: isomerase [Burkholderiales bacterium RIFCSPHIGHO2_02_FULL_66_10]|uniref:nuclear transport factor 2 family protein n=1 Tax=Hydrogenophaga sp. TaxID=1904254 RepID=UPI0008CDD849|nr:nuclear transport factor 2 family protein [Hydrogenophaga sp.]MBU4181479.1 nuclear transport factor 2 family protein [Gammaproteobacteria bacterium]OGB36417.1 MAG: isomerase [Burkholderiales bacterium RIFCSPLOWO2_02_FULL_66_35]OGB38366.1 MAG: isomerase [Burkholderiales bacterium RIFCSPHIGHO2_02_FULL_66_10]MBU4282272.1 nuclear transport factor 2 family protein [Gammaproteobacteria bacterium]MBU4323463.1 nuclear transport factor 2 family protein [Gammaproteobacteria bacterium]